MRHVLTIAAAAGVVLLVASPAGAGSAKAPTLKSLQAQITTLQKQVKTLKKRAALDENVIALTLEYSVCSTALTADAFQDTFTGLDAYFATQLAKPAYFGTQTPVNDYKTCSDFEIVRAHNQSPPNTNILRALLDIFKARSFAAHGVDLASPARHLSAQFFALARGFGSG
jgi:hypothetical protein